jgi:hypothetical protein
MLTQQEYSVSSTTDIQFLTKQSKSSTEDSALNPHSTTSRRFISLSRYDLSPFNILRILLVCDYGRNAPLSSGVFFFPCQYYHPEQLKV